MEIHPNQQISGLKKKSALTNQVKAVIKMKEENNLDNFISITGFNVIQAQGDYPDSKAFFICGSKDRSELFIYGGAEVNKVSVSHEVHFFEIKEKYYTALSNISQVRQFLGLSSNLLGHSFEKMMILGAMKIFIFGGFNGADYTNKSFLIDCDKDCKILNSI